ncbi:MAG: SBBP repeat-containing protein [Ignavibacteria bacterium]|jgi:hypothetical protein
MNINIDIKLRKNILICCGVIIAVIIFLTGHFIIEVNYTNKFTPLKESGISKIQIPFVSNEGQLGEEVKFYAQTFGGSVFVTEDGEIVYSFSSSGKTDSGNGLVVKEKIRHLTNGLILGEEKSTMSVNYFKGNNQLKWNNNIPAYSVINFGEIFDGIDLRLRAFGNNVEKVFCVQPGADPGNIQVKVTGAENLTLNSAGELLLESSVGNVSFTKPVAYQQFPEGRTEVDVAYTLEDDHYGFKLTDYDSSFPLIIDPLLASTFIGGTSTDDDYEPGIAVDNNGNIFVTGVTHSVDFPTSVGAFSENLNGGTSDRFVSKFNTDLTTLIASTFIGGNGNEYGMGIKIDDINNIYLAGYTTSSDFPTTTGAYNENSIGGLDAFVLKIDNDLTTLSASTYLGGTGDEGFQWPRIDLAIAGNGDVYVTGLTKSADFSFTTGVFDSTYAGGNPGGDVFVSKFDSSLQTLSASTFLGGNGNEWRVSIVLDTNENVFVCGETQSLNFPTSQSAYNTTFNGGSDIFISKLSSDLTALNASTFFGGSNFEEALAMRIDNSENIVIAGYTTTINFPTTPGAYDQSYNGGTRDAYVAIFNNDLTTLQASSLLGGSVRDTGEDIIIDEVGNIYIVGETFSVNFPTTNYSYDEVYNGGDDVFISKFNSNLTILESSTFLGSVSDDKGQCIARDDSGYIYIAGVTSSLNFPVTELAYDTTFNGGSNDCFVAKFDSSLSENVTSIDESLLESIDYKLYNNFPNPFNPTTTIGFQIPSRASVYLAVYDILGNEIAVLLLAEKSAGYFEIDFSGQDFSSGIYFYHLKAGNFSDTKKMVIMK